MDLICYLHPGWEPHIRPAEATRDWMDKTNESFAYRCLPLNIANAHGWEVLSPCDFTAFWRGGTDVKDVIIRTPKGTAPRLRPPKGTSSRSRLHPKTWVATLPKASGDMRSSMGRPGPSSKES